MNGGKAFNASCYELTADPIEAYDQAVESCKAAGGVVATITSSEENDIVKEVCGTRRGSASDKNLWWKSWCWIGLRRIETPEWVKNESVETRRSESWRWESG